MTENNATVKPVEIDNRPIQEILNTIQPGEAIPVWANFTDNTSAVATVTSDRRLCVFTNVPEEMMHPDIQEIAQSNGLTLDYRCIKAPEKEEPAVVQDPADELPFPEGETPVVEAPETPLENDSPAVEETPVESNNDAPASNTDEIEPTGEETKPIDDSLSRNKLLNRMYSPEEIDILRKAANNKPTATWGDDMKRAYASKAPTDAKMGVGDLILGAVWTVITLPIVIPWNILKTSAVTVNHFANKSKTVRMAKAAATEIPKYRKENPKQKEDDGKPKTSLLEKIKGFFGKLFKKKDAPVVAEPEKEQAVVPNVQPIEDTAGKQSLNALIQDAQDTPDKAPAARAKEKEAERE